MAEWVGTEGNDIPDNAIRAGYESDGLPLYIARTMYQGGWISGKAGCHLKGCHFPYGGMECIVDKYEVLVYNMAAFGFFEWKSSINGEVPANAFGLQPGYECYIVRSYHHGSLIPGRLQGSQKSAYVSYEGQEIAKLSYDVLCFLDFGKSY